MPTNILFLMTDQHSISTLGCYGNSMVDTPNIDRLASIGTRFDHAFTPTAICTPARASLLTGYAPFRHKLLANYERNVGYIEDLADGQFTFAESLQSADYRLGLIGKWHGGVTKTAATYGFEGPAFEGWHNPVDHPDYLAYLDERRLPPYEIGEKIRGVTPNGSEGNLLAARLQQPLEATFEHYLATRTIEMLERFATAGEQDGRPFYLATHFFGPHLPYILPDEFFDRYDPDEIELPASVAETFDHKPPVQQNYSALWTYDTLAEDTSRKLIAAYWGYVSMIDLEIGRILDAADRLGLLDDLAIMFTADHGEFTGAHRLHDKGPAMYDDIYRIPALIKIPGCPSGQVRHELVSLTDFTATILDVAGLPTADAVDSRSLTGLVAGQDTDWPNTLLAEFHGHHFPYPQRMLRSRTHKLIVNPESVNELYDLQTDPDELSNRIDDPNYAQLRTELMTELYRQLRERGDNFYHWMTPMFEIGAVDYDSTLSSFESN